MYICRVIPRTNVVGGSKTFDVARGDVIRDSISHKRSVEMRWVALDIIIYTSEKFTKNRKSYTPFSVAERSKAWVCSRSPAGIAGSNPAGGMDVCCESSRRRRRRNSYTHIII